MPVMPMVGVRLPKEEADTIRRLAVTKGRTPSIIIRSLISEGLAREDATPTPERTT